MVLEALRDGRASHGAMGTREVSCSHLSCLNMLGSESLLGFNCYEFNKIPLLKLKLPDPRR